MPEAQNTFVEIHRSAEEKSAVKDNRPAATLRWRDIEIDLPESASADFIRRLIEGMAMLKSGVDVTNVIVLTGKTDLRKGVDGLAALVRLNYELNPMDKGTLFLFCGIRLEEN